MTVIKTSFNERCYELLRQIPAGKVTTYREMARALNTRAWRAVGTAMAKNQQPIVIPCHRVIRSNGEIGEYALGAEKKAELLKGEGVPISGRRVRNLDQYLYTFTD